MNNLKYGFVGLGQMGRPMAENIARKGYNLSVFDKAGTNERAPKNTFAFDSINEIAGAVDILFLSLPDANASLEVVKKLAATNSCTTSLVIELSTIGVDAAKDAWQILNTAGITYIDAPVSGGQSGARAGTITIMWAGPRNILEIHKKIMMSFCKNLFHVGDKSGQGQALKILNNFLSGTAMAATSEAVAFGLSQGLDMKNLLNVINVSTGQNTATSDKFPNRILTGTFDAGFKTSLLTKDMKLYLESAKISKTPIDIANAVMELWNGCNNSLPNSDFTEIYNFISRKN